MRSRVNRVITDLFADGGDHGLAAQGLAFVFLLPFFLCASAIDRQIKRIIESFMVRKSSAA